MNNSDDICAVFLCNQVYFSKFINSCTQLITNGKYKGPICLVIGDDLHNSTMLDCEFIKSNNIIIKHFPNIEFSSEFIQIQQALQRAPHWIHKLFQFHKFYLFHTFFKQWKTIFYLDCGITIYADVSPIINERKENALVAHSDGYPTYQWKLSCQFDHTNKEYYPKFNKKFNLNNDYFQTTMMLYDTSIIKDDTYTNLLNLLFEFPISCTNDQGIIALYFTQIEPLFEQIKVKNDDTYFYDYLPRGNSFKYIMLKRG
jgi:hypothetical protein